PVANTTRAARAVSAGTAKSLIWSTRPCGIAACCALATFVAEWTMSSRRPGSATLVGSGASMADTLLPSAPLLAGSRTDTGIIAPAGMAGRATPFAPPAAQRPGANAHPPAFDRHAEGVLHRLDGVQADAAEREPAVRRDRPVERRRGRPPRPGGDHGTVAV